MVRWWPSFSGIWTLSPLIKKRCQSWTPSGKTFWIRACLTTVLVLAGQMDFFRSQCGLLLVSVLWSLVVFWGKMWLFSRLKPDLRLLWPQSACSLNVDFVLADIDEKTRKTAFHLGLHCLTHYPYRVFWSSKGWQKPYPRCFPTKTQTSLPKRIFRGGGGFFRFLFFFFART